MDILILDSEKDITYYTDKPVGVLTKKDYSLSKVNY